MPIVQLPPIISIFGYKDSGKTTVIKRIISHLHEQQYRILSAKHVGEQNFSLDSPGTDSYRHLEAGAVATFLQSESSTTLLFKKPITPVIRLLEVGVKATSADIVVLEGFRFWTQKHPKIAKIICIRTLDEIAEFQADTIGPILGQCTLNPEITTVIRIPDEFPFLLEAIDHWLPTAPKISLGENNGF